MRSHLQYIKEPILAFGYGQKTIDSRDGIMLFGPYTKGQISIGNFGIIGTTDGIRRMREWLKAIEKPISSTPQDIARPFFPGIEAAFDFSINRDGLREITVEQDEIKDLLHEKDGHQRTHNLVNLYADELIKYSQQEEVPVTVWFVVIPDEIYQYSRPKSKAPVFADRYSGIKDYYERHNPSLFEDINKLQEAYLYEINFHNQLKAKLLKYGIITQIIRERTIAYRELLTSQYQIEREMKFDSAKAWNISAALYYKSGGLPWKLGNVRKGVCYVGLVYKKLNDNPDERTACCAAQMFLDSGDGLVFKGNVGPWYNPTKGEYHLSEESAYELLAKALETFKKRNKEYPGEIFIHAKTYFNDEEWGGFENAVKEKSKIVGVRIVRDASFKLYREAAYSVPRGSAAIISEAEAYMMTQGFVPRIQTQMGLEVPNPLNIKITRGDSDILTICSDVLSLTKLNYNTCVYGDGIPVTLRFADMIGEVLTAGPTDEVEVLPFKHYI